MATMDDSPLDIEQHGLSENDIKAVTFAHAKQGCPHASGDLRGLVKKIVKALVKRGTKRAVDKFIEAVLETFNDSTQLEMGIVFFDFIINHLTANFEGAELKLQGLKHFSAEVETQCFPEEEENTPTENEEVKSDDEEEFTDAEEDEDDGHSGRVTVPAKRRCLSHESGATQAMTDDEIQRASAKDMAKKAKSTEKIPQIVKQATKLAGLFFKKNGGSEFESRVAFNEVTAMLASGQIRHVPLSKFQAEGENVDATLEKAVTYFQGVLATRSDLMAVDMMAMVYLADMKAIVLGQLKGKSDKEKMKQLDAVFVRLCPPTHLLKESWHIWQCFLEYPAVVLFALLPHYLIYTKWSNILHELKSKPIYAELLVRMRWDYAPYKEFMIPFRITAKLSIE